MRLAHQLIRFVIVQEALMNGIPPQRAVETIADDTRMADDRAVMADFRRADAVLMLADAVEEIVMMVAAFVEADVVCAPFRPHQFLWFRI